MNLRPATTDDIDTLVEFNTQLASETENHQLDTDTLRRGVSKVIDNPHHGFYTVAESDDQQLLGCLLVTFEWSDWRDGLFFWVQSVYVHPDARRKGVFSALLDHVAQLATDHPECCGLRLYVDNDNSAARATYLSRGFSETNYRLLERYPL